VRLLSGASQYLSPNAILSVPRQSQRADSRRLPCRSVRPLYCVIVSRCCLTILNTTTFGAAAASRLEAFLCIYSLSPALLLLYAHSRVEAPIPINPEDVKDAVAAASARFASYSQQV
jgi:hypothetical protein